MSDFIKYRQHGSYHWTQTNPDPNNERFNAPLIARYQVLLNHIPDDAKVGLDIGCGDGYLLHLLLQNTKMTYIVGVDSTTLGIQLGQSQLQKQDHKSCWHLSIGSAYKLSFPSNTFDYIIMADVIEHLDSPEQAVNEAYRLLTSSGVFILSTPNWQPDRTWDRLHVQEFTPQQLTTLLSTAFNHIALFGYWPMTYFGLWKQNEVWRQTLQNWTRAGFNPFEQETSTPTLNYGQLVAVCRK